MQVCNQKFLRESRRRFVELGHFNKDSIKNTRKRGKHFPTGKHFGVLSPWYSFFNYQEGQGKPPLSPTSCVPVKVAEYASISLNIPKDP